VSYSNPTADRQINLKTGDYYFWARAKSLVLPNPDNIYCRDTFMVHVGDTGYIAAMFKLSSLVDTFGVAPQDIEFVNLSYMVDSNYISPGYFNVLDVALEQPPFELPDADYAWRFYHIPLDSIFDKNAPIEVFPWELPELINGEEIIEEENPVVTFEKAGYYKTKVVATSEFGCKDTTILGYWLVEGVPTLTPGVNVITPNGDGINDNLEFDVESLRSMEGKIFNRWGKMVFSWTWNEETQEAVPGWWDGKLDNGQDAPPGIYYYVVKGIGQKDQDFSGKEYSGFIHLIREK
jgi:gliding motility-associated-like protein